MSESIDAGAEEILIRADRRVLKTLSPHARCVVLVLRLLGSEEISVADLEARIESFGFKCSRLDEIIDMLSYYDMLECRETLCRLSSAGRELSGALNEFLHALRRLVYGAVRGSIDEDMVASSLVATFASTLGLIESYVEEPSMMPLYLPLHLYIAGISTVVLAQLARVSASVLDVVKRFWLD